MLPRRLLAVLLLAFSITGTGRPIPEPTLALTTEFNKTINYTNASDSKETSLALISARDGQPLEPPEPPPIVGYKGHLCTKRWWLWATRWTVNIPMEWWKDKASSKWLDNGLR